MPNDNSIIDIILSKYVHWKPNTTKMSKGKTTSCWVSVNDRDVIQGLKEAALNREFDVLIEPAINLINNAIAN